MDEGPSLWEYYLPLSDSQHYQYQTSILELAQIQNDALQSGFINEEVPLKWNYASGYQAHQCGCGLCVRIRNLCESQCRRNHHRLESS